jgi:hypothetical protein
MKGPNKAEWALGELLIDPQKLFVLWAVKVQFCVSLDDFRNHYGPDFPISELVGELRQGRFLQQGTGELVLTETGEQAVACLGSPRKVSASLFSAQVIDPTGSRAEYRKGGKLQGGATSQYCQQVHQDEITLHESLTITPSYMEKLASKIIGSKITRDFSYGKLLVWGITNLAPALGIFYSNFKVFPNAVAVWLATILIVITAAASLVLLFYSGAETIRIRHYCLILDLLIAVTLWGNMVSHFQVARDLSAAKDSVDARHAEEDRQEKLQRSASERFIAESRARRAEAQEEVRRLSLLPHNRRRSQPPAPAPQPATVTTPTLPTEATPEQPLKPEDVLESWLWRLWLLASAESGFAILGLVILRFLYGWDVPDAP